MKRWLWLVAVCGLAALFVPAGVGAAAHDVPAPADAQPHDSSNFAAEIMASHPA